VTKLIVAFSKVASFRFSLFRPNLMRFSFLLLTLLVSLLVSSGSSFFLLRALLHN
jgi:hypothetical protein